MKTMFPAIFQFANVRKTLYYAETNCNATQDIIILLYIYIQNIQF